MSSLSYTFSPQRVKMAILNSSTHSPRKHNWSFLVSPFGVKALGMNILGSPQLTVTQFSLTESL